MQYIEKRPEGATPGADQGPIGQKRSLRLDYITARLNSIYRRTLAAVMRQRGA